MIPAWFTAVTAGSPCGDAARDVDWAATPLGDPVGWPAPLRQAVELCFSTRFPVLVTWGDDLVMVYNDGYREMLGDKHPAAMGAPCAKVWAEVWPYIEDSFAEVLTTGRPTWTVDQRLLMQRSGFEEETWFTYSYSALRDEDGAVRGVLDIATETTERVVESRRLRLLSELARRLHGARDVEDVGRVAADLLALAPDDVVATDVHLLNGEDLLLLATTRAREGVAAVDHAVLHEVARTVTPRTVGRTLVAPLRKSGESTAVGVAVLEAGPLRPFDEGYLAFLELLATNLGAALGAAVRRDREVGALRHVADTLQLSMLPGVTGVPDVVARYQPKVGGLAVGGDWYDAVRLPDGRTALVVGDCVGHGLGAAAVMGQLRSAVRALLLDDPQPAPALTALDTFAGSVDGAECATALVAVLDADAGTLTSSCAGHVPAAILRADGTVDWLGAGGDVPLTVPLGLPRTEQVTTVGPGDTLVLYTDGLVEHPGTSIDDGLAAAATALATIGPASSLDMVADGLLRRLLPHGARDDVALLVHRVPR